MKKRIIAASLIGLLVLGTSCEDKRDEFLSDYDTRMYFRNSDLQEQDCYITGDIAILLLQVAVSKIHAGVIITQELISFIFTRSTEYKQADE